VGECEPPGPAFPFRARSFARPACPRRRGRALLSWGSDTSRSPWSAALSRALVTKSLFDLHPATGAGSTLEVFAPRSALPSLISAGPTSLRFSVPFRVSPSVLARPHSPGLAALLGFLPLRRLRSSGAHSPRACLTRYVAPSGFHSLLAPCFSGRLPALFHAGNALGVRPSEPFPQLQPGPSRDRVALLPFTVAIRLGFRAFASGAWVRCRGGPSFRSCRSPMLSWAFPPLQGSPLSSVGSPFGSPPPMGFSSTASPTSRPSSPPGTPSGVSRAGKVALDSLEPCRPSWGSSPRRLRFR